LPRKRRAPGAAIFRTAAGQNEMVRGAARKMN